MNKDANPPSHPRTKRSRHIQALNDIPYHHYGIKSYLVLACAYHKSLFNTHKPHSCWFLCHIIQGFSLLDPRHGPHEDKLCLTLIWLAFIVLFHNIYYEHIPKLQTLNKDLSPWPLLRIFIISTTRINKIIHIMCFYNFDQNIRIHV